MARFRAASGGAVDSFRIAERACVFQSVTGSVRAEKANNSEGKNVIHERSTVLFSSARNSRREIETIPNTRVLFSASRFASSCHLLVTPFSGRFLYVYGLWLKIFEK